MDSHHFAQQDQINKESLQDPQRFWTEQAQQLEWAHPPSTALITDPFARGGHKWRWFPNGKISTTYNCLTRHIEAGYGDQAAIIWDSPVTDTYNVRISYAQLLEDVQVLAGVLRGMGVKKGSRVLIYMPMMPPALVAMLATAHLGAIHSVVFGGFAPAECGKRIASCEPEVILTATCGIEGGAGKRPRVIPYLPLVREAIKLSGSKAACQVVAWQREQCVEELLPGERDWRATCERVQRRWREQTKPGCRVLLGHEKNAETREIPEDHWAPVFEGVAVDSNDPLYIIYTSGTTGLPKGVVREAGGHAVGLNMMMQYLFGIKAGDTVFTASDIGWVVGHSYIVYAPLLVRATTVLFEGKPVGTPSADTFWRIISQYRVNVLFTAPTALRAIRREDPQASFFKQRDLKCLRGLFLAGERSEAGVIEQFQKLLDEYCAPGARVVDNWWSTESGSPMTGVALGVEKSSQAAIRPGSAGKPMPGWDIRAVDDDGREVKRGQMGNIVLGLPMAPTAFRTLWKDDERFSTGYLDRFNGKWVDTGDAGMVDQDGYVHIMSRTDDVINVAAHRFSTGTIEQAISSHPLVAECCVVGMPDTLKGHVPFAFVHLNASVHKAPPPQQIYSEINNIVRAQIGPIASLGGVISSAGQKIIPKTRSGKTLRRVIRELVEAGYVGQFDKGVSMPPTIEDPVVIESAREVVKHYFLNKQPKAKL